MSKTPREILEKLYRIAATQEPHNDSGKFTFNGIDTTLTELKEAVLAAKPQSNAYWATFRRVGYDEAANDFEQAILTMFEGE